MLFQLPILNMPMKRVQVIHRARRGKVFLPQPLRFPSPAMMVLLLVKMRAMFPCHGLSPHRLVLSHRRMLRMLMLLQQGYRFRRCRSRRFRRRLIDLAGPLPLRELRHHRLHLA